MGKTIDLSDLFLHCFGLKINDSEDQSIGPSRFLILFFWVKMGRGVQFLVIFHRILDFENFYKCLTFLGGKNIFFQKCPNNGLVSEKTNIFLH